MNTYLSTITLKVYRQSAIIKRHRVAQWKQKQDLVYAAQETQSRSKGKHD